MPHLDLTGVDAGAHLKADTSCNGRDHQGHDHTYFLQHSRDVFAD
jgi:hypothetical protein